MYYNLDVYKSTLQYLPQGIIKKTQFFVTLVNCLFVINLLG